MEDLKQITKVLEEKIDASFQKLNTGMDEKASKAELNELNKSINNLKAALSARQEDADRDTETYVKNKSHWTKSMRQKWAREFGYAMEQENIWGKYKSEDRLSPKEFRKNFLNKAAGYNEEDAGAGFGFLPTMVDSVIHKLVPLYGVARNYCRVLPGIRGSVRINNLSAYPTVTRTGTTNTPRGDGTVTPTAPTLSYVTLQPLQSSAITTIEEKLIWDSVPGVIDDSADNLSIAAGLSEDTELFLGDPNNISPWTGIKNQSIGYNGNATVRTGAFTNFDPLLQMRQFVYPSVARSPNTYFHMTPATFAVLQTFKASTSGLYFYDISQNNWVLSGSPIAFNQVMDGPDSDGTTFAIGKVPVIFGDLYRSITMGLGRDYQLRILTELYAANNELGVRLTWDWAYALVLSQGITKLTMTS